MKKLAKTLFMTLVATVATGALADAADTLVKFSTKPTDLYADGTPVQKGEWYALCWSPNATFGGLNTDCTAAVEGDKVLLVAPLAAEGYCPPTIFELDSKTAPVDGNFFVLLLDTRDAQGKPAAADETTALPAKVNGVRVALGATSPSGDAKSGLAVGNVGTTSDGTFDVAGLGQDDFKPASLAITMNGNQAVVSIIGANPAIRYNVAYGSTVTDIKNRYLDTPVTGALDGSQINVVIQKDDAKFFKLVRE